MSTSSAPLKGIALLMTAMAFFPLLDVCAKFLGQQGVPVVQMVWARFFFGALYCLPFALRVSGVAAIEPVNLAYNTARACIIILGTAFFFLSLKYLPIADTLAIFFIQPILVTALSPLLLNETVGLRRWVCVAIGFVGVLIIVRPGFQEINLGVFYALFAGFLSALFIIITRHLTGKADAMVTTFQTSAIGALVLTVGLPWFWMPVSGNQWMLLLLLGAIATVGQYLVTRAYDFAEASLLSPFNYAEIITAVAAGWYFFNDFPDNWTLLGVSILITCAVYISWRERPRAL